MAVMVESSLSDRAANPLRILFLGLPGVMAEVILHGLLSRQACIAAVVTPLASVPQLVPARHDGLIPIRPPGHLELQVAGPELRRTLPAIAWEADVPLYAAGPLRSPDVASALRAIAPDIAVVTCYSQRIPHEVLEIPRLGFLNVHPSLLPAYRGPAPAFWQFRDGAADFGLTVHFMDEAFDSGDIAAQAMVEMPAGISGPEADERLALAATSQLVRVLDELAEGVHQRHPQLGPVTAAPWPEDDDFSLPVTWTARRAFTFIRGTQEWNRPYRAATADGALILTAATSYEDDGQMKVPFRVEGEQLWIRFSRGVLHATGHREVGL